MSRYYSVLVITVVVINGLHCSSKLVLRLLKMSHQNVPPTKQGHRRMLLKKINDDDGC